jgi:hypothetical protein
MRMTLILATEVLLRLPPHLQLGTEAQAEVYKTCCSGQPKPNPNSIGMLTTWNMKEEPILWMWTDKMITRNADRKPFMVGMGK